MCGFAGMINRKKPVDLKLVMQMTNMIRYRGPDDQSFAAFQSESGCIRRFQCEKEIENIFPPSGVLGFNRLSIRDTSISGRQPMIDETNKILLLFNGEIYNSEALKSLVENWTWKSKTDTEVVLALYERFGIAKTLSLLNGMFSLTIVDLRSQILILARDRIGIKPLYYYVNNEFLMFASEMKCFLCNPHFFRKLNCMALYEYFTFGDAVTGELLEGVNAVHPGNYIEVSLKTLAVHKRIYFELNHYVRPAQSYLSENEAVEALDSILKDCICRQMLSDVPVGCQLSGGVDSSLVAYYARNHSDGALKESISIIPVQREYSEEPYIQFLNQKLGIHGHLLPLHTEFIINHFEKAVWHYENIITYHNLIALLLLSGEAKRYVTVLLSGEGADELYGGYTWFEDGYYASKYLEMKQALGIEWSEIENQMRGLKNAHTYSEFAIMASDIIPANIANQLFLTDYKRNDIINQRQEYFEKFTGSNFDKHIKYEMSTRLVSLLMRQDKTSMANSIENRVPLLDNEIIDFAFSLPENYLLHSEKKAIGKYIMKKLCERHYGEQFAFRRKVGFPLPFHEYMYHPDFKAMFYEKLLPQIKRRGIMDGNFVQKLYEQIDLLKNRWEFAPLWKALSFEVWCEQFLDGTYVT